ncbi:hypothetical protein F4827_003287 [Paraburkholderia bannensis]|uniref:Uncharacterized protein n=1 Tax=Paraburkholderia bannensis TaxID=765414 RepID=A0A7W9TXW2_9BURK|nr:MULTISPECIES: hypothetical protein [Paraburkholderia]MBB3258419.1 hypothetical protein [Paraburkholderia sp. WP4_3_2]MBB6103432.1 hypothetical protein [Paraburkholderia bannensis]
MQIGSLATPAGDGAAYTRSSNPDVTNTTTQNGAVKTDTSNSATPVSQDDAVEISPQGYAAASNDASPDDATDDAATASSDASTHAATGTSSGESSDPANAQPVRSLVYGALGLARPDQPPDPNHAYSFGRWLAAGITVGGLISLLI